MIVLPAIDLYGGKVVRLLRGDYAAMTVYDDDPLATAQKFEQAGAGWVHMVDLEGAKNGGTPAAATVRRVVEGTGLCVELGGGVRTNETIEAYLNAGVKRVILGTAALTQPGFVRKAVATFGADSIAVGADLRDGFVAVHGWTQQSAVRGETFCASLQADGVRTVIVTDIAKDGAMQGTNLALYAALQQQFSMDFIASGGVSRLQDVKDLAALGVAGAIIGKAYYTGAIDLAQAVCAAKGEPV